MKSKLVTAAAVAAVVTLCGCGDRQARGVQSSSTPAASEAPAPAAAAATFPAVCGLTPQQAAAVPVLPPNASRGTDGPDYHGLRTDDERLPSGEYYDVLEVGAEQPGQHLRVRVTSDRFTPRVILYDTNGCPWIDSVASSGGAAIVDERLDRAGEYRVLITSSQPGVTGAYSGDWGLDGVTAP